MQTGASTHVPENQDIKDLKRLAEEIAALVTVERLTVRQMFDYLLEQARSVDVGSFLHAVMAGQVKLLSAGEGRLDPADDRQAIMLALIGVGGRSEIADIVSSAVSLGLFDVGGEIDEQRRNSTWEKIRKLLDPASPSGLAVLAWAEKGVGGTPQAITNADGTWIKPDALHPAIMRALRRLCKVRVAIDGQPVIGSGLLIGPNAILTNHHVVEKLPDELDYENQLRVQFPFSRTGHPVENLPFHVAAKEWLIAKSPMGLLAPANHFGQDGKLPWWEDSKIRNAWATGLSDCLDFAIIRLKEPVGIDRGYYDLSLLAGSENVAELEASLDGSCHAFHLPGNQGLCLSSGVLKYVDSTTPNRAFHSANTAKGSSGGLLLNGDCQPVALHHAGYDMKENVGGVSTSVDNMAINGSIPLATIYRSLSDEQKKQIRTSSIRSLTNGSLLDRSPVFGRKTLFEKIDALIVGEKRFLLITCEPGLPLRPGKSFTIEILKSVLPPPDDVFVVLTPEQVKNDGVATAELILAEAGIANTVALPEKGKTTEAAYYANELVPAFAEAVSEKFRTRRLWLVLDELDELNIPDAGGRSFLNALYAGVLDIPELRVVLIGLDAPPPAMDVNLTEVCPLSTRDFEDLPLAVDEWLSQRGFRDKAVGPGVGLLLGELLASTAAATGKPMQELSDFTKKHLLKPLDTFLSET